MGDAGIQLFQRSEYQNIECQNCMFRTLNICSRLYNTRNISLKVNNQENKTASC